MTRKLYYEDPYMTEFTAQVLEVREEKGKGLNCPFSGSNRPFRGLKLCGDGAIRICEVVLKERIAADPFEAVAVDRFRHTGFNFGKEKQNQKLAV